MRTPLHRTGPGSLLLVACLGASPSCREGATTDAPTASKQEAARSAEPTEPWPAPAAAPPEPADEPDSHARRGYRVQPGSIVRVSLPAKEEKPAGSFRIVRGLLEIDLVDLARSRGTIEVDLGSVLMEADGAREERQHTAQARNWLHLGASRPDAEIERVRFARFVVSSLERLSHPAPHLGNRLAPEPDPDAPGGASGERRRVALTVTGELELNGLRVRRTARAQLDFHYPAAATPGLPPTRVRLSSVQPLVVPLAEHEIQPRDAHGRLAASELDLLGRVVGRNAQISYQILAAP